MKIIAYIQNDNVCIGYPSQSCLLSFDEIVKRTVPVGSEFLIIEDSDLPQDRFFRDAWKNLPPMVDMEKALTIAQNEIRKSRESYFSVLDVQFMKALEQNDSKTVADITAKKQILRDAPVDLSLINAKNPEELKSAMNSIIDSFGNK